MASAADPASAPELRPLGIGEILDVGIKVYTKHLGTLLKTVAVVLIPVQAVSVLITLSTIPDSFTRVSQNPFDPDPNAPLGFTYEDVGTFFAGSLVAQVLYWVGVTLATGAAFKAISNAYLGAGTDWKASLRFGLRHLRSLLWITSLTFLVYGGVFTVIAIFSAILIALVTVVGIIVTIVLVLGTLVFVAWLWASWATATPALLTEGVRGTKALGRSFGLVRGRWWPSFAVLLLAALIAFVVNMIVSGGISAITFTDIGRNIVLSQTLNGVGAALASILSTPFQAAIVAVLYFDLRVRKEGFDLQLLAQRIGTETPEGARAALLPPPIPSGPYNASPPAAAGAPAGAGELPPTYPTQVTNGKAVASLILGLTWIAWIGSIVALPLGYSAKKEIERSNGAQAGRGVAIAGIVLGWIGIGTLGLTVLGAIVAS